MNANKLTREQISDILSDYGRLNESPNGGLLYVMHKSHGPFADGNTYCVENRSDYGAFSVSLVVTPDGELSRSFSADVSAPSRWDTTAKVDWPTIGPRTPAEARIFSRVLGIAANVAEAVTVALASPQTDEWGVCPDNNGGPHLGSPCEICERVNLEGSK